MNRGKIDLHAEHGGAQRRFGDVGGHAAGVVGLETCLSLLLSLADELGFRRLLEALCQAPARLLGLEGDRVVAEGAPGDLVVVDPGASWVVDPDEFLSRSGNTPFKGWRLGFRAVFTLVAGEVVFSRG